MPDGETHLVMGKVPRMVSSDGGAILGALPIAPRPPRESDAVIGGYVHLDERPAPPAPKPAPRPWRMTVTLEAETGFESEAQARAGYSLATCALNGGTFPAGSILRLQRWIAKSGRWHTLHACEREVSP
jgi:hypothetical protein